MFWQLSGKEVYMAVYTDLGAPACRILVPNYSEIYPIEDLIWDNTNKLRGFRSLVAMKIIINWSNDYRSVLTISAKG